MSSQRWCSGLPERLPQAGLCSGLFLKAGGTPELEATAEPGKRVPQAATQESGDGLVTLRTPFIRGLQSHPPPFNPTGRGTRCGGRSLLPPEDARGALPSP